MEKIGTELALGDWGFVVEWKMGLTDEGQGYHVDFKVRNVVSRDADSDEIKTTEEYLTASIKWDGCSHLNFGEDGDGYLHLCGGESVKKHAELMLWLHRRAFELMCREEQ